jgi:hypothetical protein
MRRWYAPVVGKQKAGFAPEAGAPKMERGDAAAAATIDKKAAACIFRAR